MKRDERLASNDVGRNEPQPEQLVMALLILLTKLSVMNPCITVIANAEEMSLGRLAYKSILCKHR